MRIPVAWVQLQLKVKLDCYKQQAIWILFRMAKVLTSKWICEHTFLLDNYLMGYTIYKNGIIYKYQTNVKTRLINPSLCGMLYFFNFLFQDWEDRSSPSGFQRRVCFLLWYYYFLVISNMTITKLPSSIDWWFDNFIFIPFSSIYRWWISYWLQENTDY